MKETANRRAVLKDAALAAFAAALGAPIAHARSAPAGFVPVLLAGAAGDGRILVNDRPLCLETPPHLLDDEVTPAGRFFVRDNGIPPDAVDAKGWRLKIDGEVENPLDLTVDVLKRDYETVTLRLALECAGNGRKFYRPAVSGQQWTFGAVGFGDWTGVRLADVLARAGVKKSAKYTGHYGADRHLSGDTGKDAISRGVPIAKAMEPHTLIAWGLNGADLPPANGHPLRLVVPGWPGSCSQKWLTRIWIRDREHDGEKMLEHDYRMPAYTVAPGASVPDSDMRVIENLPIKSLISYPATGAEAKAGAALEVRGCAWGGERQVARVDISLDFGATWIAAELGPAKNKYAPRRWRASLTLPRKGYYEIAARAADESGRMQPMTTPGWNPKGYLNNMQHRVAVFAV